MNLWKWVIAHWQWIVGGVVILGFIITMSIIIFRKPGRELKRGDLYEITGDIRRSDDQKDWPTILNNTITIVAIVIIILVVIFWKK